MSCQSLSLAAPDQDPIPSFHRSVHFSNDGERKSMECSLEYHGDPDSDTSGGSWSTWSRAMSTSAPATSNPASIGLISRRNAPGCPINTNPTGSSSCGNSSGVGSEARFPRLEECAHFHYGRVRLGGLRVRATGATAKAAHCEDEGGWITVSVCPHSDDGEAIPRCSEGDTSSASGNASISTATVSASPVGIAVVGKEVEKPEWMVTRSAENFKMLDTMLHRCIYDRKVSGLPDLSTGVDRARNQGTDAYESLISDYLHHFSIIADDTINCGPILNWFQMDNKGHRLLVASEDSNSINTPAVAAAYSVRKYVSQARDEISFEVGDMISVIDMPGPCESTWWRGKRGFSVGFFPQQCVAVIGDKVPRNMKQPPPIIGSVAVAPIKPVLRKHGKLISLFRSFILSRPSRRALRQQGILRERVFGCDLGEHLLNSGHEVPLVLSTCASIIEQHGCVDGIYRLSGASSTTQRLRLAFDEERPPPPPQDIHAVASLLKMYFRELPNPLCTYQLYSCFVAAVQGTAEPREGSESGSEVVEPRRLDDSEKLLRMRETVVKLPPPHYRTLAFLMRHLHGMSLMGSSTGMTARNMAIVWAPNLLRSPLAQHALQGVAVQAVVTEFLICYAELIFFDDQPTQGQEHNPDGLPSLDSMDSQAGLAKRPKSLPLATPTKLLSLEEAQSKQQLRPSSSKEPHYIEVGGGPNSLPRYHTVIQLPSGSTKRGLKRSPSGWRGLFFRATKHRPPTVASSAHQTQALDVNITVSNEFTHEKEATTSSSVITPGRVERREETLLDAKRNDPIEGMAIGAEDSRLARSCESLVSEGDSLPPLISQPIDAQTANHHNRSVSCDSYFEASLAELAGMRLRLTSQEREMDIFSEDDTTRQIWNKEGPSSGDTSAEPSPTKLPRTADAKPPSPLDSRKRTKIEEQLSDLLYIDCSTPVHGAASSGAAAKSNLANNLNPSSLAVSRNSNLSDANAASMSKGADSPSSEADAKRVCKEQQSTPSSVQSSSGNSPQQAVSVKVKMRDHRGSPRKTSIKSGSSRHSHTGLPPSPRQSNPAIYTNNSHRHSTLIKVDWPSSIDMPDNNRDSIVTLPSNEMTQSMVTSEYSYTQLHSDSEASLLAAESKDSLARRLIDSKESLNSRNIDGDSMTSSYNERTLLSGIIEHFDKQSRDNINCANLIVNIDNNSRDMLMGNALEEDLVLAGVVVKDGSEENLDGMIVSDDTDVLFKSDDSNRCLLMSVDEDVSARHYANVAGHWSNGGVINESEKADEDCFMEVNRDSAESKNATSSQYENVLSYNSMKVSNAKCNNDKEAPHYDDIECPSKSAALKLAHNIKEEIAEFENRCSVTVTPSDENFSTVMIDSLEESLSPTNISYQNLNRLSTISGDSGKACVSKESTPTYSPREQERTEEIYECFSFARPSYIHLASSSGGSSTPTGSPTHLKSPIKSTISITYKSPLKESPNSDEIMKETVNISEDIGVYEDVGEFATVPKISDACLPTQQACQPIHSDVTGLEHVSSSKQGSSDDDVDIYNQVKFFRQSVNEVNTLLLDSEEDRKDSSVFEDSLEGNINAEPVLNVVDDTMNRSSSVSVERDTSLLYENVDFNISKSPSETKSVSVKSSPLAELCLDRRIISVGTNKPHQQNSYENYQPPKSDSNLSTLDGSSKFNAPKLSLGDFDKENTADNGGNNIQDDRSKSRKPSATSVRQLAHKFESPTENKPPFSFEIRSSVTNLSLHSHDPKMSSSKCDAAQMFDRSKAASLCEGRKNMNQKLVPCVRIRNNRLAKHSVNTRSLDENAFIQEFGRRDLLREKLTVSGNEDIFSVGGRRKSFETGHSSHEQQHKRLPDLNLNLQCETGRNSGYCNRRDLSLNLCSNTDLREDKMGYFGNRYVSITPTTENKISLVQARLSPKKGYSSRQRQNSGGQDYSPIDDCARDFPDSISSSENSLDRDKRDKLSRERIEKYKEERRLFLREKFSPHSFRGVSDLQSLSKNKEQEEICFEGVQLRHPNKLERRNTADAAQRSKFSVVRSVSKFDGNAPMEDLIVDSPSDSTAPKVTMVQRKLSLDAVKSAPLIKVGALRPVIVGSSQHVTANRPKTLGAFGIATSVGLVEEICSPDAQCAAGEDKAGSRKEKRSPSFNIRHMTAKFEQKSNQP